jgi:protein SCO1/2
MRNLKRTLQMTALSLTMAVAFATAAQTGAADKNIYEIKTDWTTANGTTFNFASLKGKKTIFTLFYTSCRSICPMTVDSLKEVKKALGPKGKDVQVVMVTIDPKVDSTGHLKGFSNQHHIEDWKVVAGSPQETQNLAVELGLGFEDKPAAAELHQMHSRALVVVDEKGHIKGTLPSLNTDLKLAKKLFVD